MEIGNAFNDIQSYNSNMARGLEDKMFFLKFLPHTEGYVFVDFGCADGTLINTLHHLVNKVNHGLSNKNSYIGFDISEQMIDLARAKMTESPNNVTFTTDWRDVEYELFSNSRKKVLILSSVIHEIYSYAGSDDDIALFWKRVLESRFDYICVRDMMLSSDMSLAPTPDYWVKNIKWDSNSKVSPERKEEFEKIWGSLTTKKNVFRYLLMYRWQINWNREVHEDYFPVNVDEFLKHFESEYNLDYLERFRVPFLDECIKEDFNISFEDTDFTHIKAVFSKKSD